MKSPITGKEMLRMMRKDTLVYRKETFPIFYHYYLCGDSGEEFTDGPMDDLNVVQAYNQYRTKYSLPFPDEIRNIREQYGVSASKMAEILGFGINVYRQYESGEVPSISNARLIQLIRDPLEFKFLVIMSGALKGNMLDNVVKKTDALIAQRSDFNAVGLPKYLMTGFNNGKVDVYTGYKTPSLDKLVEMIVFFSEECKPWKTKLNKLLFYADFSHYKKTGFSISGAEYRAIQMGPVPLNFGSIFEYAAAHHDIDIIYRDFKNGGTGELFQPYTGRGFKRFLFSDEEYLTMEEIIERFKEISTGDIIKLSHEEPGWVDNFNERNRISYDYAFGRVNG